MAHARASLSLIICLVALLENIGVLADFYGGWSLYEQECPAGASICKSGICCPPNTFCHDEGIAWACCPDRSDCGPTIKSFPVCADPSLVLYKGRYGEYFCCPSNQQGIYPANGAAGLCVASDMPVSATQSAVKVSPTSSAPTSTGSSSSSISAPSAPTSSSTVTSIATSTATESSATQSTTAQSTTTQSTSTQGITTPGTTVSTSASATKSSGSAGSKSWFAGVAVITAIGAIVSVFMVLL